MANSIRVTHESGVIRIEVPSLFEGDVGPTRVQFVTRLLQENAVQGIAFDSRRSHVEIHYDRSVLDSQSALRTLSDRLAAPGQPDVESLLTDYLSRMPGRLKRVSRAVPEEALTGSGDEERPNNTYLVVENLQVELDDMPERQALATDATAGEAGRSGKLPADVTRPWTGEIVIGGVRRIVNLTAAGGCFVMSIIGVVTPGVPTVPFVLATGYFLARSSPRLHARLRRAPLFGPMLTDYEDLGGLRWTTKLKAITLTVGLIVVTVVIAGLSIPLLLVAGLMGSLGIYMVARIPTAPSRTAAAPAGA